MNNHLAWTTDKPTAPGYYLIRGFAFSDRNPFARAAVVEVGLIRGELRVNLHETNSDADGIANGYRVADLDESFEWCPLLPQVNAMAAEQPEQDVNGA